MIAAEQKSLFLLRDGGTAFQHGDKTANLPRTRHGRHEQIPPVKEGCLQRTSALASEGHNGESVQVQLRGHLRCFLISVGLVATHRFDAVLTVDLVGSLC